MRAEQLLPRLMMVATLPGPQRSFLRLAELT
jgi:hypothetical protein